MSAASDLASLLKKAINEHASAAVLRDHIALIDRATKPLLEEHKQLQARVAELEDVIRHLTGELQAKARAEKDEHISESAFKILCWIFDEDGEVTDERIVEKLEITMLEVNLYIATLYEKCYISYPSDGLDDPPGYRIIPAGTAYVLKHRGRRPNPN